MSKYKFKCNECPERFTTYNEASAHSNKTHHSYKKLGEQIELNDQTLANLVEVYGKQVEFARKLTVLLIKKNEGLANDTIGFYEQLFPIILEKVLTPAIYLE